MIEPGAYATGFNDSSAIPAKKIDAYDRARSETGKAFEAMDMGDPAHTAGAILAVVDAAEPLRLLLGKHALPFVHERYAAKLREWDEWNDLAVNAQ